MPRALRWLPLGLIVVLGALLSFRLGWIDAHLTETAAIEAYAARYVSEAGAGARPSDCSATPGDVVWLVVRCGPPGAVWEYHVNRFGGLRKTFGPGEAPVRLDAPQEEPRT